MEKGGFHHMTEDYSKMDLRELEEELDSRNLYISETEKKLEKTTDINEHNKFKTEIMMLEEQRKGLREILYQKYGTELGKDRPLITSTNISPSFEDTEEVAQLKNLCKLRDKRLARLSMEINQLRYLIASHQLLTSLPSLDVVTLSEFEIEDITISDSYVVMHLREYKSDNTEKSVSILFKGKNYDSLIHALKKDSEVI